MSTNFYDRFLSERYNIETYIFVVNDVIINALLKHYKIDESTFAELIETFNLKQNLYANMNNYHDGKLIMRSGFEFQFNSKTLSLDNMQIFDHKSEGTNVKISLKGFPMTEAQANAFSDWIIEPDILSHVKNLSPTEVYIIINSESASSIDLKPIEDPVYAPIMKNEESKIWRFLIKRDFHNYPINRFSNVSPTELFDNMFYQPMHENAIYNFPYVVVFAYQNQYYGIPIYDKRDYNKIESNLIEIGSDNIIGIFQIFGDVVLEDNKVSYALILELSNGTNVNIGITPTQSSMLDNIGSFVVSYFDLNAENLVKVSWKKDKFGRNLVFEDKLFVDIDQQIPLINTLDKYNDEIRTNRRSVKDEITKRFNNNETIKLSSRTGERSSYEVGSFRAKIIRFTYIKKLDQLKSQTELNTKDLERLPKDVLIHHILKNLGEKEYIKLCSTSTYFREICLKNDESIWQIFLNRDFGVNEKEENKNFKETYQFYDSISIRGIYKNPIVLSNNSEIIEENMNDIPGYNPHAIFIKKIGNKYRKATIMLNTNAGYFYSIWSNDPNLDLTAWRNRIVKDKNADSDRRKMILFLLKHGYKAVVGIIIDGQIKQIYEMKKKEYKEIKIYMEHIDDANSLAIEKEIASPY